MFKPLLIDSVRSGGRSGDWLAVLLSSPGSLSGQELKITGWLLAGRWVSRPAGQPVS